MSRPVKFKNIDGWLDYEDYYEEVARFLPSGSTFVEVGVWKGRSICYFAEWCRILGKDIKIFGVDMFGGNFGRGDGLKWADDTIDTVRENLNIAGVGDMVTLYKADSAAGAALFEDNSLDFVWLDADHTFRNLCRELISWSPKVKNGGILAGHDWDKNTHPDVQRALDAIGIRYRRVSRRSWASKKIAYK